HMDKSLEYNLRQPIVHMHCHQLPKPHTEKYALTLANLWGCLLTPIYRHASFLLSVYSFCLREANLDGHNLHRRRLPTRSSPPPAAVRRSARQSPCSSRRRRASLARMRPGTGPGRRGSLGEVGRRGGGPVSVSSDVFEGSSCLSCLLKSELFEGDPCGDDDVKTGVYNLHSLHSTISSPSIAICIYGYNSSGGSSKRSRALYTHVDVGMGNSKSKATKDDKVSYVATDVANVDEYNANGIALDDNDDNECSTGRGMGNSKSKATEDDKVSDVATGMGNSKSKANEDDKVSYVATDQVMHTDDDDADQINIDVANVDEYNANGIAVDDNDDNECSTGRGMGNSKSKATKDDKVSDVATEDMGAFISTIVDDDTISSAFMDDEYYLFGSQDFHHNIGKHRLHLWVHRLPYFSYMNIG
ncbi:hypothetical protein ZWY2020_001262, partial [Hordeum vulgare]